MNTKKIKTQILAILIFLIAGNLSLYAQGWKKNGGNRGMRGGQHFKGGALFGNLGLLKQRLDLNDNQFQKIAKLNLQYQQNFLDLKEKLAPMGIKLRKLLLAEKVDLSAVKNILLKMANLKVEIRMNRIKQRLAIEKFLSAKQRLLLKSLKGHKRRGHRRGGF